MNRERALEIARDRLDKLDMFQPENESEVKVLKETKEFLEYVECILERKEK